MQQQPAMMNMLPPFPPASITTEQIQKYLDENKKLILAILDNQNLGKLAECAQYQAQLQKNLMYLAAIADAQPQAPAMPSQVPTHPAMQQGGHYMQHPHAAAMNQQPGGFPSKMPMQLNPQQMQEHQQQQQQQQQLQHQAVQAHFGMRPGASNGMQGIHNEVNPGGGSTGGPSSTSGIADFTRSSASGAGTSGGGASGGAPAGGLTSGGGSAPGDISAGVSAGAGASGSSMDGRGSKQDGVEASSGDAQGNTTAGNSNVNGEPSYTKGSENA